MPDPTAPPPKYLPAVAATARTAPPGQVTDVFILHAPECALLAGVGPCNCDPDVTRGFVLWYRKGRRTKWEAVATRVTKSACYDAIAESGRKGGDWLVLDATKQP